MASTLWNPPLNSAFSGAKLYHYAPGTSTLKNVYPTKADADAGTNPLAQPVVLDSVGYAQVWLDGQYKLILKNAAESVTYYTVDNVGDATDENTLPQGYIAGLGLSVNTTDSDHDIDIAAGAARDAANTADIELASGLTKQMDATWAAGTNAGGMEDGTTIGNNAAYAVWLIRGSGSGDVDVIGSASASAPSLPTGYDQKELIGGFRTDGSANIVEVWNAGRTRGGRTQKTVVFTSSGTWTKRPGLLFARIIVTGGGGAGGGVSADAVDRGGGGGAAGGTAIKLVEAARLGATETVTVSGTASAGAGTGANGGTSSMTVTGGTTVQATGGNGGAQGASGTPSAAGASTSGAGTGGDINLSGGHGTAGADSITPRGGNGGGSYWGGGGAGGVAGGGSAGPAYGSGGGGAGKDSSAASTSNGGPGAAGIVIVEEFY